MFLPFQTSRLISPEERISHNQGFPNFTGRAICRYPMHNARVPLQQDLIELLRMTSPGSSLPPRAAPQAFNF